MMIESSIGITIVAFVMAVVSMGMFIVNFFRRRDPGFSNSAIWLADQSYLLFAFWVFTWLALKGIGMKG